jgi:hypothetical protein
MLEDLSSDISARPVRSHMGHLSRDSYFSRGIPPICARNRSFSSSELCHNQTDPLPDHVVNLSSLDKLTTCRFRRVVRESAVARGFAPATMCSAIWRFCFALGVFGTGTGWPDTIVATIMAALAIQGAALVIRQASAELRSGKLAAAQ